MKLQKQQSGMALISGLILSLIFIAIIILAVKLVPPYINNYLVKNTIHNIVKNLENEPVSSFNEFRHAVTEKFDKHLNINGITSINRRDLIITQTTREFHIGLVYDVKVPIVGNLNAIIHFRDSIKVPKK